VTPTTHGQAGAVEKGEVHLREVLKNPVTGIVVNGHLKQTPNHFQSQRQLLSEHLIPVKEF